MSYGQKNKDVAYFNKALSSATRRGKYRDCQKVLNVVHHKRAVTICLQISV